jgi:hypothetical protein
LQCFKPYEQEYERTTSRLQRKSHLIRAAYDDVDKVVRYNIDRQSPLQTIGIYGNNLTANWITVYYEMKVKHVPLASECASVSIQS